MRGHDQRGWKDTVGAENCDTAADQGVQDQGVGVENPDMAPDQGNCRQPTDPALTVGSLPSMIPVWPSDSRTWHSPAC
jgi:hypothetical protein